MTTSQLADAILKDAMSDLDKLPQRYMLYNEDKKAYLSVDDIAPSEVPGPKGPMHWVSREDAEKAKEKYINEYQAYGLYFSIIIHDTVQYFSSLSSKDLQMIMDYGAKL